MLSENCNFSATGLPAAALVADIEPATFVVVSLFVDVVDMQTLGCMALDLAEATNDECFTSDAAARDDDGVGVDVVLRDMPLVQRDVDCPDSNPPRDNGAVAILRVVDGADATPCSIGRDDEPLDRKSANNTLTDFCASPELVCAITEFNAAPVLETGGACL